MRRRLASLALATTSLVLVAFLVPLAVLVQALAAERATGTAAAWAGSVAATAALGDRDALAAAIAQAKGAGVPVTVFLPGDRFVGEPAAAGPGVRLARLGRSLTVDTPQGREVLVAVQGDGTTVVRALVPPERLREGVTRTWLVLGLIGLALLALGALVADRLARSLIGPVAEAAGVSRRLAGGDLAARVTPDGPPEIRDVGTALNQLAGRIDGLLRRERESVADLSHRLRTPVTALRLEVDAMRDREDAARVGAAVASVERMVTQVITEARRSGAERGPGCDAAEVVAERVAFWSALADDQNRRRSVRLAPGPLPVPVRAEDLAALVDLLLENVFAHTPEGTAFAVDLTARPGGARLTVSDEGPGFPGSDLVERGVSGAGSTGLGLDIARRTAEESGGSLRVRNGPAGAEVIVDFGNP
ncbi:HAMP domain-containing sensor histidine kinase [Herbidospora sp. NBRC 101105]|uniref:sensor histidine kinase n=1 Tax=Herbidospora sp. NBRC 101105 TaxID=3032195 RepID=UPI0024A26940|nr:HAMP domain-containing sensor histidine kinase [Herbidospora sp. NBRC 101105]GLX93357.1 two-component sensor histidine kinase [Herbidospora sp. NBRC 101105]